jgi:hypothetical protein
VLGAACGDRRSPLRFIGNSSSASRRANPRHDNPFPPETRSPPGTKQRPRWDGRKITGLDDFDLALRRVSADDEIPITALLVGKPVKLKVTLGTPK